MGLLSFGRRDPWWDQEGSGVRRQRRMRRVVRVVGIVAALALIVAVARPLIARAASLSVNLDQFATLAGAWQNGNLNGNNARYPEGGIVPFRLAIEGLKAGTHRIHINYDFTAGGHKAYDFLATWNAWSKPNPCGPAGGGISSMCPSLPAPTSFPIPSDPFKTDGLSVNAAEIYSGVGRRMTIWGGTIESISVPTHTGSPAGNSSVNITVTFTASGSSVLLAWGGHLAQSAFWDVAAGGPRDGAGTVSGAPWHMRTLNLDDAGAKNQDRSIQPSAIVGELPPRALAPATPRPATPPPPPPAPVPPATPRPVTPPASQRPGAPVPTPRPRITPPPTTTVAVTSRPGGTGGAVLLVMAAGLAATVVARRYETTSRRRRLER